MPVVVFYIFVAVISVCILGLGYCLSSIEKRTVSRRCRIPYEMHRRRKIRKQRVRCRFEG